MRAVLLVLSILSVAIATTARADEFQGLVDALGKANFAQMQNGFPLSQARVTRAPCLC